MGGGYKTCSVVGCNNNIWINPDVVLKLTSMKKVLYTTSVVFLGKLLPSNNVVILVLEFYYSKTKPPPHLLHKKKFTLYSILEMKLLSLSQNVRKIKERFSGEKLLFKT